MHVLKKLCTIQCSCSLEWEQKAHYLHRDLAHMYCCCFDLAFKRDAEYMLASNARQGSKKVFRFCSYGSILGVLQPIHFSHPTLLCF